MNIQYRYFSLDKFLDDAVGNGVSNIELWGAMPFFNIEDMTYQEVKEVRHQIESRGLKLVCLTPEQCVSCESRSTIRGCKKKKSEIL